MLNDNVFSSKKSNLTSVPLIFIFCFPPSLVVTSSTVTSLCRREWELIRHLVCSGRSSQETCPWPMMISPSVSWSYAVTVDTMGSLRYPMPARAPPRLAVVPSTTLMMYHPTPPITSISVPGSMIILGASRELMTSFRPRLARQRLRFVPWSLPSDPFFLTLFLCSSDRNFEVVCRCNASSNLEEVDSSLLSDSESLS